MNTNDLATDIYLKTAIRAVKTSGDFLLNTFGKTKNVEQKESIHSILVDEDISSNNIISGIIRNSFPEHKIISEETAKSSEYLISDSFTWVIDPLDGSSYYSRGIPTFSISVALLYKYQVVLGVVYCPTDDELFYAIQGKGTYLNSGRIYVSSEKQLSHTILSIGHSVLRVDKYELTTKKLLNSIRSIRAGGSCAQELCYVACGRIDGLISLNQSVWDYAAGKILVEEAGGSFSSFSGSQPDFRVLGKKNFAVVASNGKIHKQITSNFTN